MGYEIEIVPSIHINRLTLEIFDRVIFRCDIRNLPFNLECDDTVCKRIIDVVNEATERLYADDNLSSYCPVRKGLTAIEEIKNAKTTQDLFSPDLKL